MSRFAPHGRGLITCLLTAAAMVVCVDPALAEPGIEILENRVTAEPAYSEPSVPSAAPAPLWGMFTVLLLTSLVLGVSLIPSKRGHQD